jgi:Ca2+-binding EF-hand superfamily protein
LDKPLYLRALKPLLEANAK